jgi:alanine dehydrogenase
MKIGVVRERKDNENRVGLIPEGVAALVRAGAEVLVERAAGEGCGFSDDEYERAGGRIVGTEDAWNAELVVKVKEPIEAEYPRLNGQIVFTYFHLAGVDVGLTEALLESKTTALAYETVEDENGRLPLLAPMSAVAGSMAPLMGAYYLAKFNRGRGVLPVEILGESQGKVLVVGDGVVGRHAARVASAMGARVLVFGLHPERAADLERNTPGRLEYLRSTVESLARHVVDADLLVGAVLVEGARTPHVVSKGMVQSMPAGSVIVDVSIDQGGCVETSRPTSHSEPVFVAHDVIHYCVTNMPGAYPRTSTLALTAATLDYVARIAEGGMAAVAADRGFAMGVNTYKGHVTHRAVAQSLGLQGSYRELIELL